MPPQAERLGLQLGDALISPTRYMTAFLRQRGWRLPKTTLVIPNVAPPRLDEPNQAPPLAPGGGTAQACGLPFETHWNPCLPSAFAYQQAITRVC